VLVGLPFSTGGQIAAETDTITPAARQMTYGASSAKISGVAWFAWVLVALVVPTVGLVAIGRGLEWEGHDMERHRD
jgi:hypothetical protein